MFTSYIWGCKVWFHFAYLGKENFFFMKGSGGADEPRVKFGREERCLAYGPGGQAQVLNIFHLWFSLKGYKARSLYLSLFWTSVTPSVLPTFAGACVDMCSDGKYDPCLCLHRGCYVNKLYWQLLPRFLGFYCEGNSAESCVRVCGLLFWSQDVTNCPIKPRHHWLLGG